MYDSDSEIILGNLSTKVEKITGKTTNIEKRQSLFHKKYTLYYAIGIQVVIFIIVLVLKPKFILEKGVHPEKKISKGKVVFLLSFLVIVNVLLMKKFEISYNDFTFK